MPQQQHLYNGLACPADYSISVQEWTHSPACKPVHVGTEWTHPTSIMAHRPATPPSVAMAIVAGLQPSWLTYT